MSKTFLALALLLSLPVFAAKQKPEPPLAKVGVTMPRFTEPEDYNWRGQQEHSLAPVVWYPAVTSAQEKEQYIGPPDAPLFFAGKASPEAPLAPSFGKYPLVVLSHGTGGSAMQMAWLGTYLAARGNIVVAVNHPGNNGMFGYTPQGFAEIWERARDITAILDELLADPRFGSRIDSERIGIAGFSLGGYTAVALAGGITSWEDINRFCAQPESRQACNPPEFPGLLEKFTELLKQDPEAQQSVQRSSQPARDPRIRAAFLIAPGVAFAFTPQSLAAIQIPLQIVVGAADNNAPPEVAKYYAQNIKTAQLTILPGGVSHYTFLDTATEAGKQNKNLFPLTHDAPGVDRDAVHQQVAKMAADFFEKELVPPKPGKKHR